MVNAAAVFGASLAPIEARPLHSPDVPMPSCSSLTIKTEYFPTIVFLRFPPFSCRILALGSIHIAPPIGAGASATEGQTLRVCAQGALPPVQGTLPAIGSAGTGLSAHPRPKRAGSRPGTRVAKPRFWPRVIQRRHGHQAFPTVQGGEAFAFFSGRGASNPWRRSSKPDASPAGHLTPPTHDDAEAPRQGPPCKADRWLQPAPRSRRTIAGFQ